MANYNNTKPADLNRNDYEVTRNNLADVSRLDSVVMTYLGSGTNSVFWRGYEITLFMEG